MIRTYWLISILLMTIPSFLGFLYGAIRILPRKKTIYGTMGVCAVFCIFIAQLADLVVYLSGHNVESVFHIGSLGTIGYLLFLLTANAGPIGDASGEMKLPKKYYFIALAIPLLVLALFGVCAWYLRDAYGDYPLMPGWIMTVLTAVSLYFCGLKLFAPAPRGSALSRVRGYNIAVTVVGIALTVERGLRDLWVIGEGYALNNGLMISLYTGIGVAILVSAILLKRGTDR